MVDAETPWMARLTQNLNSRQWMPFISVSDPVEEEVMHAFHVNIFDVNNEDNSF